MQVSQLNKDEKEFKSPRTNSKWCPIAKIVRRISSNEENVFKTECISSKQKNKSEQHRKNSKCINRSTNVVINKIEIGSATNFSTKTRVTTPAISHRFTTGPRYNRPLAVFYNRRVQEHTPNLKELKVMRNLLKFQGVKHSTGVANKPMLENKVNDHMSDDADMTGFPPNYLGQRGEKRIVYKTDCSDIDKHEKHQLVRFISWTGRSMMSL